jgi:hypothetical protein
MNYNSSFFLVGKVWNNALSWEKRKDISQKEPTLFIPKLIEWNISDVVVGNEIVFEEIENGKIQSCKGLESFVKFSKWSIPVVVFDNHNHALYFWLEALKQWVLEEWFELIHIDEHSDLWKNEYTLDKKRIQEEEYVWIFTNNYCNVGNYIVPAIDAGIIWNMIRIENEFELDTHLHYTPHKNSVLNLDLDFFSPEMDFINENKKISFIRNLIPQVRYITIATSPFFINQDIAIQKLKTIFSIL